MPKLCSIIVIIPGIMLNALVILLFQKLCWHNRPISRRGYFLAATFSCSLSSMEDFLFSARCSLVVLNLLQQDLCHIALWLIKVTSIPLPSSRRSRSIGMGRSCNSLKLMMFADKGSIALAYPNIMTLVLSWTLQYFIGDFLAKTALVPISGFLQ